MVEKRAVSADILYETAYFICRLGLAWIIAGTIRNSVSLASLESKWQQKKQVQQEEKERSALSDVSLSGETVDVLEEIKRMAEGFRTGIPENVTNRNTDNTAGSIDLKI